MRLVAQIFTQLQKSILNSKRMSYLEIFTSKSGQKAQIKAERKEYLIMRDGDVNESRIEIKVSMWPFI